MTENQENAIATETTLNRSLCAIADKYPVGDVIEQLASILFDRKLEKTSEQLDVAVDIALAEVKGNAR